MKLLSNGNIYLDLFGKIYNSEGVEMPPTSVIVEPARTNIAIQKIEDDVFEITAPTPIHTFRQGERINLVSSDFDIKVIISEVGNNNYYKVVRLFENVGYDYDEETDIIIPDGITNAYRILEALMPINLEDGRYYTEYGSMLLVSKTFYYLAQINVVDIYGLKPELRGKTISDWELSNMLRLAFDFVMDDIAGIEFNDDERFKYINIKGITKLILYKTISIYESSYPDETGRYAYLYGNKYKSALNGFRPYAKIDDNGKISTVKKKGIRW